ncbi:MAG: TonB-dependent receptor plug domain-containing protein, partial [Parvularculaceae bacterium]|nr:TonB-dependent receptor plug domain-containing protein [Parvularculaceae bacterium]
MKSSFRAPLLVSTALVSAALIMPAQAQSGPSEEGGIDTIIVTAQRREENLQKVPLSVSAFSAEELQQQGTNDVSRLEGRVPGFTFGRSGVDARPAIRGVRTENVGVNGDTTIGFFVDGIYQSRAAQATLGFVDLERVEVQRGPQGTLYGRNTFGGNISIVTAQPQLGEYSAKIGGGYGENNHWSVDGVANIPLGEIAAFRIVAQREKSDGWVKNINPLGNNLFDNDDTYARASFLFKPNDRLTATVKYDYSQRLGAGGSTFGYKLVGSYFYTPTNAQLFNAT